MTFVDEYYQEKMAENAEKVKAELEKKHAEAIISDGKKSRLSRKRITEKLCLYLGITKSKAEEYYNQMITPKIG